MTSVLHWFRNDLRLHDQPAIARLPAHARFLGVYFLEPRFFSLTPGGWLGISGHRLRFLRQSLADLKASLQARGSDLVILAGKPEDWLPELIKSTDATKISWQVEHTRQERDAENAVRRALSANNNLSIQTWEGLSLIHPEDLPYRQPALPDGQPALPDGQPALSYRQPALQDLPDVFTAFRKAVEKSLKVREPFADPGQPLGLAEGPLVQKAAPSASLPVDSALHIPARSPDRDLDWPIPEHPLWRCEAEPDPRTAFPFSGGEANALERLASYVRADGALRTYKETRNGMVGADYSSKLSAWLANGSLSPRQVYHAVKQHEATYGANDSTYWMVFELLWRDFFRFQAIKQGDQLFALGGPQHKNKVPDAGSLPEDPEGTYRKHSDKGSIMHLSRKEIAAFERWAGGQTGQPFIDANMRELAATGWMSNRGRQNAASYLVHDLSVDWRLGAWWFEALLLDYDVASNWGNWQYAAGVGLDPRSLGNGQRRFNPEKQAAQYDPDGEFVRLWADKTG